MGVSGLATARRCERLRRRRDKRSRRARAATGAESAGSRTVAPATAALGPFGGGTRARRRESRRTPQGASGDESAGRRLDASSRSPSVSAAPRRHRGECPGGALGPLAARSPSCPDAAVSARPPCGHLPLPGPGFTAPEHGTGALSERRRVCRGRRSLRRHSPAPPRRRSSRLALSSGRRLR